MAFVPAASRIWSRELSEETATSVFNFDEDLWRLGRGKESSSTDSVPSACVLLRLSKVAASSDVDVAKVPFCELLAFSFFMLSNSALKCSSRLTWRCTASASVEIDRSWSNTFV